VNWEEYKRLAQTSRELIVFPFFTDALCEESGVWLDVGCGTGDLTCHVAETNGLQVIGVDKAVSKRSQEECSARSVHLVKGDLLKNGIAETGVIFDGAYSNCCFCHLGDDEFMEVLVDIYNCLKVTGDLVFLVPSIEWAREMYSDISHEKSGITAIPRYGDRQHFRIPAWYVSALLKAGFELARFEQVLIPDNPALDARYRSKSGTPLFTAFFATRGEAPSTNEAAKKAFDIAHDNRKLEIQLFWQRSLFFWGFVAAALVGYMASFKDKSPFTIVFALFGLVCSVVWSQGNRGSKYWQEYWEKKVNFFQHHVTGNIFYDRKPTSPGFWEMFEGRRVSVSKLTMALSDFTVFLWACLCVGAVIKPEIIKAQQGWLSTALVLATLFYCLFFLRKSKSED
jgi:SAM-dependent methyltransferase